MKATVYIIAMMMMATTTWAVYDGSVDCGIFGVCTEYNIDDEMGQISDDLNAHEDRLNEHDAILDGHGAMLDEYGNRIDRHDLDIDYLKHKEDKVGGGRSLESLSKILTDDYNYLDSHDTVINFFVQTTIFTLEIEKINRRIDHITAIMENREDWQVTVDRIGHRFAENGCIYTPSSMFEPANRVCS